MQEPVNSLTVSYIIHAPVQEVFKAWITPQLLQRWGPERAHVDARVGGSYRFESSSEDAPGQLHVVTGEYRQIVPGHLLEKTWVYQGPMAPDEKVETLVTVAFHEKEPKVVELIVTEQGPSLADEESREAGVDAWMEALKMLEILCSSK